MIRTKKAFLLLQSLLFLLALGCAYLGVDLYLVTFLNVVVFALISGLYRTDDNHLFHWKNFRIGLLVGVLTVTVVYTVALNIIVRFFWE